MTKKIKSSIPKIINKDFAYTHDVLDYRISKKKEESFCTDSNVEWCLSHLFEIYKNNSQLIVSEDDILSLNYTIKFLCEYRTQKQLEIQRDIRDLEFWKTFN